MILLLLSTFQPLLAAEPVEIVIEGIEGDALTNVREALALPHGLVREGKVDRLWLERFQRQADEKVQSALQPFGYYRGKVTTSFKEAGNGNYLLYIQVEPGEPVLLTEIEVALFGPGAGENSLKSLAANFPLRKGDVLVQPLYERGKGAIKAQAQELGYLDAEFSAHEIRIAPDRATATIKLALETGPRYFFDGATIEGAAEYPEKFLRRHLAFKPGENFSYGKLGETQLNFTNSERFKEVVITPEKEKAEDYRIPVLVRLQPLPRWSLRPGVGYGTDTGARFSLRYRDLNMLHLAHDLNANLYVSERLQGLATVYTIPGAKNIKTSTGIQLNLQREEVTNYVSRFVFLELNRNRTFGAGQLGTAYIRVQQEDFTIGGQQSSSRLVLPGIRFSKTRYDDVIRPTRGYRLGFDLRGTHQYLGSDTGLIQLIGEASRLMPLPWRLGLFMRAKAGMTLQNDPLADLPVSLRFFAGGDRSVRGYSYKSLAPRDADGQVVGGRHLVSGSIELTRALFKNWGTSVFYDTGNAFNSFDEIRLFHGAGVGMHYFSPVGIFSLYLARQFGLSDPGYRIHFTVGFEL